MPDDTETQTTDAAPPSTVAPSTAPAISPELLALIDERVNQAYDRGAADARRSLRKQQQAAQAQPAPRAEPSEPQTAPAQVDVTSLMKLRDDFDDAISELTLTAAQKKLLREHVMEKRPADVASYIQDFVGALGIGKPAAQNAAPTPPQPVVATQPATPMQGSSPPARVVTSDVRIVDMSPADRAAYAAKIGPTKFRDQHMAELRNDTRRFALRKG